MVKDLRVGLAIFSLGAVLGAQNASAGPISVEVLANSTYSMATGTPAPTSGIGSLGGGLNFNLRLGSKVAMQLGGHYMNRLVTTDMDYRSTYLSVNGGFKFMASKAFSVIVGGYYNKYYSNSMGLSETDAGATAGIGLAIPLGASLAIYINPMYRYGLVKQTYGSASTLTSSEIVGFAGIILGNY
jgi:hypothetical protein